MNWLAILWLALFIVFLMAEASTVAVISLWFALGALAAMIASLLGGEFWLQAVLFFAVSAVLLLALRPLTKKFLNPKITRTNIDAIVGTKGIVTQEITNDLSVGQVKLNGMEWSARSTSGEIISAGTMIQVDKVEGVKVFVSALEVKVN